MDAYRYNLRSASATFTHSAAPTIGLEPVRPEFYDGCAESDRTLRMDMGGLCHLCGRKTSRRVEMHSPLWKAGPIMYGECCLPRAEAALRAEALGLHTPGSLEAAAPAWGDRPGGVSRKLWLTFAATAGIGVLAAGLERLMYVGLAPF